MKNINIFDADERIIINSSFKDMLLSDFTKEHFLDNLNFTLNISTDDTIINLVEGLKDKIKDISKEEWANFILELPLETYYSEDYDN
jgi:hypothetical protein